MPTFTVHAAKTNLSKLIERAENGEEVIIARGNKPVARLVPISAPPHVLRRRAFGALKGKLNRRGAQALGRGRRLMAMLLDTHALIWWVEGDARITSQLRRMLGQTGQDVYVSAATAWEIATKTRLGKLRTPRSLLRDFVQAVDMLGFLALPITLEHGYAAGALPGSHRDPFDRMLAAQARAEDMVLVSCDPAFARLGVETLW
jgi:prevent-host-death family protein